MHLKLLEDGVKNGIINLHLSGGKCYRFGVEGLETDWVVHSEEVINKIARDWEFQLGQTYVQGGWDVLDCDLRDLLSVLRTNFAGYTVNR